MCASKSASGSWEAVHIPVAVRFMRFLLRFRPVTVHPPMPQTLSYPDQNLLEVWWGSGTE
eukprot:3376616-Pyramimonas_sp.AAC.1